MTVPSGPRLLAQAVEALSSEERQQVIAWLLERSTATPSPEAEAAESPAAAVAAEHEKILDKMAFRDPALRRVQAAQAFANPALREVLGRQLATAGSLHGEHQLVPVRLPAELHTRLRDWCTEHDFTMATVIRGLVAKFLEGQEA